MASTISAEPPSTPVSLALSSKWSDDLENNNMYAAQHPTAERGALLRALLEPDLDSSLTPFGLLTCNNQELFVLLPLVLAAVQRVGEIPGNRSLFVDLVDALRTRVSACRAVKLRLLLLAQTAGFQSFWNIKLCHRNEAYAAAWAHLSAVVANSMDELASNMSSISSIPASPALSDMAGTTGSLDGSTTDIANGSIIRKRSSIASSRSVSRVAEEWLRDRKALRRYAVRHLFHPTKGVPLRDHVRRLRHVRNSFKASELVDVIVEHANFRDRSMAVPIGQMLQDDKLITRVGHRDKPFTDSDKIYQSSIALDRIDAHHACICTAEGKTVHCWTEFKKDKNEAPVKNIELKVPSDMIDLQSYDFWRRSVYLANPVRGYRYGYIMISHPMAWCQLSHLSPSDTNASKNGQDQDNGDSAANGDSDDVGSTNNDESSVTTDDALPQLDNAIALKPGVVGSAVVRKVFSSIARPMIIELQRPVEERWIDDENAHETASPPLLVKEGDNLGQDLCVEVMFRCFNMIWEESPEIFPDATKVPFAYPYEVFPTDLKQGFMEAVSGLEPLKDFDWEAWKEKKGKDHNLVSKMVMSAAGSYVGAYILGAADRHQDNVQIKDGETMLHIDFGFLLGSTPPIDGPRFAIYPQMEKAFRDVDAWDMFVNTCEKAFVAIRRLAPEVIRSAVMLFTKFGFADNIVRSFLTDKFSLNTHEKDEKIAAELVRNQVLMSSSDWKTRFKAYSHAHVDPAFYSLLEKRFPPAVLAMKIVDAKEQKAIKRQSIGPAEPPKLAENEKISI